MRTARAKVIDGEIVTRAKFPEGTKLWIFVDESPPGVGLDDEDVAAINCGSSCPNLSGSRVAASDTVGGGRQDR